MTRVSVGPFESSERTLLLMLSCECAATSEQYPQTKSVVDRPPCTMNACYSCLFSVSQIVRRKARRAFRRTRLVCIHWTRQSVNIDVLTCVYKSMSFTVSHMFHDSCWNGCVDFWLLVAFSSPRFSGFKWFSTVLIGVTWVEVKTSAHFSWCQAFHLDVSGFPYVKTPYGSLALRTPYGFLALRWDQILMRFFNGSSRAFIPAWITAAAVVFGSSPKHFDSTPSAFGSKLVWIDSVMWY